MPPALLGFANEISATCVRLFAYVGGIALIAIVAFRVFGAPTTTANASRAQWTEVERPFRAFAASVPDFADAEPDYAIRRNIAGGGRKDIMSWGPAWNDRAANGSRLMIQVYRPGHEITRFGEVGNEIAARTAEVGGPYPLTPVEPIDSKFGRFAVYDFLAHSDGQARNCLGFARTFKDPLLQIGGWYCKANAEVIDRGTLACALERLSLLMAASEPKITELFARAELKRKVCGPKSTRIQRASNTRRRDWIDARKTPKLRGRVATR